MNATFLRLSFPIEKFNTDHSIRTEWDPSTRRIVFLRRYPHNEHQLSIEVFNCDDVLRISNTCSTAVDDTDDHDGQLYKIEYVLYIS